MRIRLNENKEVVKTVADGLVAKGGYCPCRVGKRPEYKCMCEEFRAQYAGGAGPFAVGQDGGTIEALTGATVTSRAVTDGVNAALDFVREVQGT